MTISSTLNRIAFACNGVTTAFPVSFPFHAQADLIVLEVVIATGVQTVKVNPTHYTISGTTDGLGHYSSGGTINAVAAPPGTVQWVAYRDPERKQAMDLTENNSLPAETVEAQFDYQTMLIQRVADLIVRSLHQPDGDATSVGELPTAVSRASKFLAFNISGDPVAADAFSSNPGSTAVSAYMATVLDDLTAGDARVTLDASKTEPLDSVLRIVGSGDATKKLAFEVDGITTGTTRTLTPPNANLTLPNVTANGDIAIGSASGVMTVLPVGSAGAILISRAASTNKLAYVSALFGTRYGHTHAHGDGAGGGDQVNDWTFTAGGCMDITGAYWIQSVALTKQLDVGWAVGNAAGLLDTGAVGNSDYYLFVIARSDTGVTDYLASLSPTAPTMPSNYDFKRLVGWCKRVAGVNVLMTTYETEGGGLELLWSSPTLDINLANTLTTTRRTDAVKVPLNFSVLAHLNVGVTDAASTGAWIYSPDQTDLAPSLTVAPLVTHVATVAGTLYPSTMRIRTSSAGLIAARATAATMDLYVVSTMGFTWARRN